MPSCEQCGVEIDGDSRFCTACGARREQGGNRGTGSRGTGEGEAMVWSAKMPVVTSTIVMSQLAFVFLAGFGFIALLMLVINPQDFLAILPPVAGTVLFLLVLGIVIAGVIQAWTRGGLDAEYAITRKGIGYRAGKTSRDINTATLAGSVLAGSATGAGGSLVNMTREMDFMEWKEMRRVTIHERERGMVFYRRALIFPIGIWCTAENFAVARELVHRYAPDLKVKTRRW